MTYPLALADREAGPAPDRNDYGRAEDRAIAWAIWRAVYRDASPTGAEEDELIQGHSVAARVLPTPDPDALRFLLTAGR